MTEIESLAKTSIDDHFERTHKYPNAVKLNEEQVRRREDDIKVLRDKYPTLPDSWLELVWNHCELTPQEEHDRIIKNKLWEKPPVVQRPNGGVIANAISVEKAPPSDPSNNDLDIIEKESQ